MSDLDNSKKPSETNEDYLKAIYLLGEQQGAVTTSRLAAHLQVTPATVTAMLKHLAEQGWITYRPYQGATLTETGKALSLQVLRSHRLAETFLVDVLKVPWEDVHAEAHRLEHALSPEIIKRIDALLGHPTRNPYGEPIPGADGHLVPTSRQRLMDLPVGTTAIIESIGTQEADLLRYVGELGLCPGALVKVVAIAPFDGPMTVEVDSTSQAIGRQVATRIFVHETSSNNSLAHNT